MAVTTADRTITLTAEGDRIDNSIAILSIHWVGATTAGHLLEISQSSALVGSPGVIYQDEAAGANYVGRAHIDAFYPGGLEITDLDSGVVQVVIGRGTSV